MASRPSGRTASTPTVLCAVTAVLAVVPWTPARANAFRSAWIPAPPPESDPAIARQTCTRSSATAAKDRTWLTIGSSPRHGEVTTARYPPQEPEQLELGERRERRL